MTEKEYTERSREIGYTESEIEETLKLRQEAKENGINMPLTELDLVEKPMD